MGGVFETKAFHGTAKDIFGTILKQDNVKFQVNAPQS